MPAASIYPPSPPSHLSHPRYESARKMQLVSYTRALRCTAHVAPQRGSLFAFVSTGMMARLRFIILWANKGNISALMPN